MRQLVKSALYYLMSQSLTATFLIANEEAERLRFFKDLSYNPQLKYRHPVDPTWLTRYPQVEPQLFELAEHIMQMTNTQFTTFELLRKSEGELLKTEAVHQRLATYLTEQELDTKEVEIRYSEEFLARTGVNAEQNHCVVKMKLPLKYHEHSFRATLDHEIGTHVFRWLNEFNQPWHGKREKFHLSDHVETEEGLAILHSHLTHPTPYMWQPALYAIAVKLAQTESFAQVFAKLEPYCLDTTERWRLCLRVKRGLSDTSQAGGYRKDACYLRGAVSVSSWLAQHDYDPTQLYAGKLSQADSERLLPKISLAGVRLPTFVKNTNYAQHIALTRKINGFDSLK